MQYAKEFSQLTNTKPPQNANVLDLRLRRIQHDKRQQPLDRKVNQTPIPIVLIVGGAILFGMTVNQLKGTSIDCQGPSTKFLDRPVEGTGLREQLG